MKEGMWRVEGSFEPGNGQRRDHQRFYSKKETKVESLTWMIIRRRQETHVDRDPSSIDPNFSFRGCTSRTISSPFYLHLSLSSLSRTAYTPSLHTLRVSYRYPPRKLHQSLSSLWLDGGGTAEGGEKRVSGVKLYLRLSSWIKWRSFTAEEGAKRWLSV